MDGTPRDESPPARIVGDELGGERSGLRFGVATTLDEVLRAWNLVYEAYLRLDLINPNVHEIHATYQAASPQSAVFIGQLGQEVKTTVTTIRDSDSGLPLDGVYQDELDALRARGRYLSEAGLFADRRGGVGRSVGALLNLMALAIHFAHRHDAATLAIGVHPHHVGFYERLFGFERLGEPRSYAAVNDKPVVLLHLPLREKFTAAHPARGITYCIQNPVVEEDFAGRFPFPPEVLSVPPLSAFRAKKPA